MNVVSLQNYTPSPRFDGSAWTKALIQESPHEAGPWTTIANITLSPVDTDPENPKPRSFTVDGTIDSGWYRVIFSNTSGTEQEASLPLNNILNYAPSVSQIATLLWARTKDNAGNVGAFTANTRPTYDQVAELIGSAVNTLSLRIGDVVPDKLVDEARRLASFRTAMLIELGYFPEQVNRGTSPYEQYKDLWEEGYGDGTGKKPGTLVQALEGYAAAGNQVMATNPGMAYFSFPVADNIGQRRM